jgi:hypothetical protein
MPLTLDPFLEREPRAQFVAPRLACRRDIYPGFLAGFAATLQALAIASRKRERSRG